METGAETDAEASQAPAAVPAGRSPLVPDHQPVTVLEELLIARGERLLHAAVLLAGSHADGEDLLQAALDFAIPVGFRQATPASTVPPGPPVPQPWTPPAGDIPPFGLQPVPAGNGLTAAEAKGDILWVRSVTEAIPASDTLVDNIFSYKSASRDLTYYPDGKPWDDDSEAVIRGADGTLTSTHTVVLPDNKRTYSVQSSPGASSVPVQQPACAAGLDLNFQVTPDAASALLGCPNLKVTQGQRIDGIGAITIATKGGTETLWINATTRLPIQLTIVNPTGQWPPAGYNSAKSPGQVEQFTFLPPTPVNLSYLASPVPVGFTKS